MIHLSCLQETSLGTLRPENRENWRVPHGTLRVHSQSTRGIFFERISKNFQGFACGRVKNRVHLRARAQITRFAACFADKSCASSKFNDPFFGRRAWKACWASVSASHGVVSAGVGNIFVLGIPTQLPDLTKSWGRPDVQDKIGHPKYTMFDIIHKPAVVTGLKCLGKVLAC